MLNIQKSNNVFLYDESVHLDCLSSLPLGWNHPKLKNRMKNIALAANHKLEDSSLKNEFIEYFKNIVKDFHYISLVENEEMGVENAIKAAFDWKFKKCGIESYYNDTFDIIHLQQAFHGIGGYCLSLTDTTANWTALYPKFKWSRIKNPKINFPLVESEVAVVESISLQQAEHALKTNRVAAIILETIQSEGGDNHFSSNYFSALRELADKYEALLIFDEVQTGVGLTGKYWSYEHFGIIPDMITFGKNTQVCGFASTTRIDEIPDNVFHESNRLYTNSNVIDMIRFMHINDIMEEEKITFNSEIIGKYFLDELKSIPEISNVRGKGLMLAFDFDSQCKRDLFFNKIFDYVSVIRRGERSIALRPPLIFSHFHVDLTIKIIKNVL